MTLTLEKKFMATTEIEIKTDTVNNLTFLRIHIFFNKQVHWIHAIMDFVRKSRTFNLCIGQNELKRLICLKHFWVLGIFLSQLTRLPLTHKPIAPFIALDQSISMFGRVWPQATRKKIIFCSFLWRFYAQKKRPTDSLSEVF